METNEAATTVTEDAAKKTPDNEIFDSWVETVRLYNYDLAEELKRLKPSFEKQHLEDVDKQFRAHREKETEELKNSKYPNMHEYKRLEEPLAHIKFSDQSGICLTKVCHGRNEAWEGTREFPSLFITVYGPSTPNGPHLGVGRSVTKYRWDGRYKLPYVKYKPCPQCMEGFSHTQCTTLGWRTTMIFSHTDRDRKCRSILENRRLSVESFEYLRQAALVDFEGSQLARVLSPTLNQGTDFFFLLLLLLFTGKDFAAAARWSRYNDEYSVEKFDESKLGEAEFVCGCCMRCLPQGLKDQVRWILNPLMENLGHYANNSWYLACENAPDEMPKPHKSMSTSIVLLYGMSDYELRTNWKSISKIARDRRDRPVGEPSSKKRRLSEETEETEETE